VVGPADDPWEREADRVAAAVVRDLRNGGASVMVPPTSRIRRSTAPPRRVTWDHPGARRAPSLDGGAVDADTEHRIRRVAGAGRRLDDGVQGAMEQRFGADFSTVRVHEDLAADELNRTLHAEAFTAGTDIFFRAGMYRRGGPRLLAHELTHVVQQGGAGVVRRRPSLIQRNPITDTLQQVGMDLTKADNVRFLANHLLGVITAMNAGRWADAHRDLYSDAAAKRLDHHINLRFLLIKDGPADVVRAKVEQVLAKGMYFKGQLNLPDIAVGTVANARTPADDTALAKQVLPVVLEEWIHMYQNATNTFLSADTVTFQQKPEVVANQTSTGRKWSLNEVDIYAVYRDLGWFSVLSAFHNRYEERQKFEELVPFTLPTKRTGIRETLGQGA
jgi:hypothetical protein